MAEQAVCQGTRPFLAPLRVRLLQGGSWVSRPLCTLRSIGAGRAGLASHQGQTGDPSNLPFPQTQGLMPEIGDGLPQSSRACS